MERINKVIVFLATAIGLIVLIKNNISISIGFILVVLFCLCLYVVLSKRRKSPDWKLAYRYSITYRKFAWGGLVVIPIVSILFITNPCNPFIVNPDICFPPPTITPTTKFSPTDTPVNNRLLAKVYYVTLLQAASSPPGTATRADLGTYARGLI